MSRSQRILAFLAYLLSPVGCLIVLLFGRRDRFAVYHMKQSLALLLFLIGVTAAWGVLVWLSVWGPLLFGITMAAFSVVIAAYVFALVLWVLGMSNALRARTSPLPIVGGWAKRLPPR